VASIPPSCLHEVFRAAEARERATGRPLIKLHVGEPHFPPPPEAVEALAAAAAGRRASYTSAEGLLELRELLVDKLERSNGYQPRPDWVFVTPGSSQGLLAVLLSIAGRGQELLLPELHWPIHLQQCLLAGFRPRFYRLGDDFGLDVEEVEAASTARTVAIVVNTPANPTGAILDRATVAAVLDLAKRRDLFVISDEAYEHFVFEGEHISCATFECDRPADERRVFATYSFSKSFAMTGYRLGYVVAPNDAAARALRIVQEASIVAPSTPVQHAGRAALRARGAVERNHEAVRAIRDSVLPQLDTDGIVARMPAGGWYAVLDVARTRLDGEAFAARMLEEHDVALAPARGFALQPVVDSSGFVRAIRASPAARHLVRLAFCGDPSIVAEGARRLRHAVGDWAD
jgi:aspartate aminotransferase